MIGDSCDHHSECQTRNCHFNKCDIISDQEVLDQIIDTVIRVVAIIIIIIALIFWILDCRQKHRKQVSSYERKKEKSSSKKSE